jgi:hypothetical protein
MSNRKDHFNGSSWLVSVVLVLLFGSMGFAYGGSVSGTVKEPSSGSAVPWAGITVKAADTGLLAGTASADALGNFSVAVPAPGKYQILATQFGYLPMAAPEVIELSDAAPDQTVNLALSKEPLAKTPPARSWGTGTGKSYLIPALEIPAFLTVLSVFDRHAYPNQMEGGKKVYSSTVSSTWYHVVHENWEIDQDPFAMNQFGHPYQGAIFHGFARSAGLNYWQALLYDNYGSYLWKMGGETDPPSINDQIATGIAGSFFGEALFRMANLMFEDEGDNPGFFRRLGGSLILPSAGFNRNAYGNRFSSVFDSHGPATFAWLQLGEGLQSNQNDQGVKSTTARNQAMGTFALAYGLPGKDGYTYTRPFDYFDFEFDLLANTGNTVENVMIRGLLAGTDYELGESIDGIWGIYGGYDYISPYIFRVSSTSLSLGTTFQAKLGRLVTLQCSVLGGGGYAAAGNTTPVGERDYHYGFAPQVLGAMRLIFGNRAMLDGTGRYYDVTSSGGGDSLGGSESVHRLNAGFTLRIFGHQALGIQYIESLRSAHFSGQPASHQAVGTVALVYTMLGKTGFGAVK